MKIIITSGKMPTFERIIDKEELYDFLLDEIEDDEIEEWIDSAYEEVEIPILGKVGVGELCRKLCTPLDWSFLRDDYVNGICEDLLYELEHSGNAEFGWLRIEEEGEEEDGQNERNSDSV